MLDRLLAWNICEPCEACPGGEQPQLVPLPPRKPAFTAWTPPVQPVVASAPPVHAAKKEVPPDNDLSTPREEWELLYRAQQFPLPRPPSPPSFLREEQLKQLQILNETAQKKGRARPLSQPPSQGTQGSERSSLDSPPTRPPPPRPLKVAWDTVAAKPGGRGGDTSQSGSGGTRGRGGAGLAISAAEKPSSKGSVRVGDLAVDPAP